MNTRRTATRPDLPDPNNDPRLLAYLRSVNDWHGYMRFLGLPHLHETPDEPLSRLFVEPYVHGAYHRADEPTKAWEKGRHRLIDLFDAKNPNVVLLGDPGAGKSTLLNWVAWNFTRWDGGEWLDKFGPMVPIPLVIRELAVTRDITWNSLCDKFLEHGVAKDKLTRTEFDAIFARGQAFVLVDGLDELSDLEVRKALRAAIAEGIARAQFPRINKDRHLPPWLLTSRIVGYDEVPYDVPTDWSSPEQDADSEESVTRSAETLSGRTNVLLAPARGLSGELMVPMRRAYCCPFDDRQVDQFARTWFMARETKGTTEGTRLASEFLSRLRSEGGPLALARIPNLLTLFALVYKVQLDLPHGRAKLYDKVAEAYLESIDKSRGFLPRFTRDRMEMWLAFVAFHLQTRRAANAKQRSRQQAREILIGREELLKLLVDEMPKVGGAPSRSEAEQFLDYVARRSGLLLPRGEGRYAFMHLSFQEYFAARCLENQIASPKWVRGRDLYPGTSRDSLNDYADSAAWTETMLLLFERLSERPQWAEELREALFGPRYELPNDDTVSESRVRLLAEILIDPYTGLESHERERDLLTIIGWMLHSQQREPSKKRHENALPVILRRSGFDPDKRLEMLWTQIRRGLSLRRLVLSKTDIADLSPLAPLTALEELDLSGCAGVSDLSPLANLTALRFLDLSGCAGGADLSPLANLTALRFLDLSGCAGVSDLAPLANLTALEGLNLRGCAGVSDLSPLANLTGLRHLNLSGCAGWADLSPLANLTGLRHLNLNGCTGVSDLSPLAPLTALEELDLSGCAGVSDLSPLANLTALEGLDLSGCAGVSDLSPLAPHTALRFLDLSGCAGVSCLSPLAPHTALRFLDLSGCAGVSDLSPLANLTALEDLDLSGCAGVSDLSPLANLTALEGLDLSGCTGVLDLSPLAPLTALQFLDLGGCASALSIPDELQRRGVVIMRPSA